MLAGVDVRIVEFSGSTDVLVLTQKYSIYQVLTVLVSQNENKKKVPGARFSAKNVGKRETMDCRKI